MIYNWTTDIASKIVTAIKKNVIVTAIKKNVRSVNKYSKNIFEGLDQCKHFSCQSVYFSCEKCRKSPKNRHIWLPFSIVLPEKIPDQ